MRIFVVNLAEHVERREFMSAQLDQLGLPYEILPAVRGSKLTPAQLATHYHDRTAKWFRSRSLVPAEIGCSLSHIAIYREMLSSGTDVALVLEDDVALPPDLPRLLEQLSSSVDGDEPAVVLLSWGVGDPNHGKPATEDARFALRTYLDGTGTCAYVITAQAARILLDYLYPVGDAADCWRRLNRYKVVDLYVASPTLVDHTEEFGSTTATDIRSRVNPGKLGLLKYKLRRLRFEAFDPARAALFRRAQSHGGAGLR